MNAAVFAGGLLRGLFDRRQSRLSGDRILFSAGLIVGEGMCGIVRMSKAGQILIRDALTVRGPI